MTGLRRLARWETLLAILIVTLVVIGTSVSPVFLTSGNVSNLTVALIEVAIMALPMALVIIAGEIDLSVESMLGLSCAVLGFLWAAGVPLGIGIPAVLMMGALGGMLNGILVTRFLLPSLVVTLGTLALFRGLALVVLGPRGVSRFPEEFTSFGFRNVPGTFIPWPFVIFAILAVILGIVLHRTWVGRQIYAVGRNVEAARYSGVRVDRLKLALFTLSGFVAALAGVIVTARFASARADVGEGMTLTVVTIVLLGGVNIFGGRGTIPGVVLAFFTLAILGNVLRLTKVSTEMQSIATGLLLILSVVVPTVAQQVRPAIDRVRGGRHPPTSPAAVGMGSGTGEDAAR
jgi:rhamnose transport system permease protein